MVRPAGHSFALCVARKSAWHAVLVPVLSLCIALAGCGGQTGEWNQPGPCGVQSTKPSGEQLAAEQKRVRDFLAKGLTFKLDEVIYVSFTGQAAWSPDEVSRLSCGVASLSIAPLPPTSFDISWRSNPTADCPTSALVHASVRAATSDGTINETISGELFLEFDSKTATVPSRMHMLARQPLDAMVGTARPSSSAASEFSIEFTHGPMGVSAQLGFPIGPQGRERYALWNNQCEASSMLVHRHQ